MIRVLIVEDELIPAGYLRRVLVREKYEVLKTVKSGEEAIAAAGDLKPDIVLMDIMLSDRISGTEAAVAIRGQLPKCIIIFLTALSTEESIEEALDSGAYAYLVKPYREKEIVATMKMACRQIVPVRDDENSVELRKGYVFDRKSKRLRHEGREVDLGPKAVGLIALLCANPGSSLSHEQIMSSLWNEPVSEQTLRSLIHRIRRVTDKTLIVNASKSGYRIGLKS